VPRVGLKFGLLIAAVAIELGMDLSFLIGALREGHQGNTVSALSRLAIMAPLGALAIFRGSRWAKHVFAGVLFLACGVLVYTSFFPIPGLTVPPEDGQMKPRVAMAALGYFVLGMAATLGRHTGTQEPVSASVSGSTVERAR